MGKKSYIDPVALTKLSSLMLRARFVVEGFISGLHSSPFRGYSLEFAQHREYSFGDEIKHLDWKVFGRSDRHFVKQYLEETNLKGYIILDASNSMGYKSNGLSKFEYGCFLSASLAYLMIRQQDSVGLSVFDTDIRSRIPPRSSIGHLSVIMSELENTQPGNETDISPILLKIGQQTRKRGLVILISDLFDNEENVMNSLKYFRFKKHEVIVFHILDPAEISLPSGENVIFEDMETKEKILSYPEVIKEEYQKQISNFIQKYKSICRESDIDYCIIETSTPLDIALGAFLAKREKTK